MNQTTHAKWLRRKRRIEKRLDRRRTWRAQNRPMLAGRNIRYEMAQRTRAIAHGGIGAVHLLARRLGLIDAIDRHVHLLKVHLPYHESDHVLNLAYNLLCDGDCLQDIERLRNDEAYLEALGASRIPDPTTAGDFCRRFESADQVLTLMEAINSARLKVWRQHAPDQPSFLDRAIIDADGTIAPTDAQCKQGIDISYDGRWGYHPLVIWLANIKEPLYLVNRSGNRPSHQGAAEYLDKAIGLCRQAGFKSVLLRGDTDFTQQENLIEQLKNGVRAMRLPVDNLISNWAYMVMASLAWSLKAWFGLMLPSERGRGRECHQQQQSQIVKMEFKRFVSSLIRLPCQIVRSGRRLIFRLLSYNPWQEALLRGVAAWRRQC